MFLLPQVVGPIHIMKSGAPITITMNSSSKGNPPTICMPATTLTPSVTETTVDGKPSRGGRLVVWGSRPVNHQGQWVRERSNFFNNQKTNLKKNLVFLQMLKKNLKPHPLSQCTWPSITWGALQGAPGQPSSPPLGLKGCGPQQSGTPATPGQPSAGAGGLQDPTVWCTSYSLERIGSRLSLKQWTGNTTRDQEKMKTYCKRY